MWTVNHALRLMLMSVAAVAVAAPAYATHPGEHHGGREWHDGPGREWHDNRYHHDHFYPTRGVFIDVLPPHPFVAVHGGARFFFSGGVWYPKWRRLYGRRSPTGKRRSGAGAITRTTTATSCADRRRRPGLRLPAPGSNR